MFIGELMTKQQVIRILQDYVNNDFEATGDKGYIADALFAVASEEEIRALGFGWVLDDDEGEDE